MQSNMEYSSALPLSVQVLIESDKGEDGQEIKHSHLYSRLPCSSYAGLLGLKKYMLSVQHIFSHTSWRCLLLIANLWIFNATFAKADRGGAAVLRPPPFCPLRPPPSSRWARKNPAPWAFFNKIKNPDVKMETIGDLYKNINSILKETKALLQLLLTYPITSNRGKRSFIALKRLLKGHSTDFFITPLESFWVAESEIDFFYFDHF